MTGREGETFPGFFMAEAGSRIRAYGDARSSWKEGDGLGVSVLRARRHL